MLQTFALFAVIRIPGCLLNEYKHLNYSIIRIIGIQIGSLVNKHNDICHIGDFFGLTLFPTAYFLRGYHGGGAESTPPMENPLRSV